MKIPEKEDIPSELQEEDRWILWFEKERNGKLAKIPAAPWKTGHWKDASPTDPKNWTSFEEALKYAKKKEGYGLGFSFSGEGPFVGIDFDNCIDEDGNVEEWVRESVEKANSYTELSPSETGLHIIGKGEIPSDYKKRIVDDKAGVEVYNHNRFFTVTGEVLKGTKIIRDIQDVVCELAKRYGEKQSSQINYKTQGEKETPFSVVDVLEKYSPNHDLEEHGEGLQGPHPKHGSDTGFNFKIVPEKNKWSCFHAGHECGGGPFELLAIFEDIIECGSWSFGDETPLKGDKWIDTIEAAERKGLISKREAKNLSEKQENKLEKLTDITKLDFAKKGKIREEVLETLKLDIKKDKDTAESILSVGLSAYSDEPQNLFLRGPSSVGKSHAITSTMNYLPEEDVELLGDLSPKALVHQRGKLVDENGNPLPPKPRKENFEEKEKFKEAKKRWKQKARNAKNLIDLQGKILVFLEAPPRQTYEMLRPILSHDTWEHEYKFAESTGSGIHTNTVVIRGWPASIFATTEADFMDDLVTRSLTITPNMSQEKFEAANEYTAEKFEIPIKNPENVEKKQKLEKYLRTVKKVAENSKLAIPFAKALAKPYPSNQPQDMRDFKKFLTLIRMQTLLHAFQRPLVKGGGEWILLSTPEDLEYALQPFKKSFLTTQTGASQEIINIYKDIFLPLQGQRPGYEEIIERYNEEMNKPISREWLRTKVVKPLEHIGWLDVEPDPNDKRKKQFKVQGEVKTFENLCAEIQGVIDRETVKKWLERLFEIPRLSSNLSNEKTPSDIENSSYEIFEFYKCLADPVEVDKDYLIRKIGDYKGKFDISQNTSKDEKENPRASKSKQNNSKVSQHELAEKLTRDYYELENPQEISLEEFAKEEASRYEEDFERVKGILKDLENRKENPLIFSKSDSTQTNIEEVEKIGA